MACRVPVQLELPLSPPRRRRGAEEGVCLRGAGGLDWREARRLADRARELLRKGIAPTVVHEETGIRLNTLHQMLTRLRRLRCGTPPLLHGDDLR